MSLPSFDIKTKSADQVINAGTWNVVSDLVHNVAFQYALVDVHLMGLGTPNAYLYLAYRLNGGAWVPIEYSMDVVGGNCALDWEASFELTDTGASPVLIEIGGYRVNTITIYGTTAVGGVALKSYSSVTYWNEEAPTAVIVETFLGDITRGCSWRPHGMVESSELVQDNLPRRLLTKTGRRYW